MTLYTRVLLVLLALVLPHGAPSADEAIPNPRTALFYGAKPPGELFAHFDRLVLEPDHFTQAPPSSRAELFAYVSVGEVHPTRAWRPQIPPGLVLAKNAQWGGDVMDTRSPAWIAFLLDKVIEPLWSKGWRGFFFDTLDSYELAPTGLADKEAHLGGVASLVSQLKKRHADAKVILNRGFDVAPRLDVGFEGLVVESVFNTFQSGRYVPTPEAETRALLTKLDAFKKRFKVPITVVDYAAPSARAAAAKQILAAGHDPWVTSQGLDEVGVGAVAIVPRTVLLLHSPPADTSSASALAVSDGVVLVAPVLEQLGYRVRYVDVAKGFPTENLGGQLAGVVTLLPDGVRDEQAYRAFLDKVMSQGVRVAFIEGFGAELGSQRLARMGLAPAPARATGAVRVAAQSSYVGFEAPPRAHKHDLPPVRAEQGTSILELRDDANNRWDAGVIGSWGGVVFASYVLQEGLQQERRFVLDPYAFLTSALALPPIPAPDVTTESGRRVLTAHIDGDGFVSRCERAGSPYTARVTLDEVLKRYKLPHTVSVIEGEVGPAGLYPSESPQLEAIAREIFALPWVEIASHTYSHPFEWEDVEAGRKGTHEAPASLEIPRYTFSYDRDLRGSIAYIDARLAPPNKKTKVLLWSGSCTPSERAVEAVAALGIANVNGGGATRTNSRNTVARASALGIPRGSAFQVFAPVENENVYTRDWLGPYYGYRQAIETFELNDGKGAASPRRIGPISIYYHFYSAAKTASLVALHEVYQWALKQETTPLYLSEYAASVDAFERATLARRLSDGAFEIGDAKGLHTVRLDKGLGFPNLDASVGVAGFRDAPQGRYVHVVPDARGAVMLSLTSAWTKPAIESANGRIESFGRSGDAQRVRVASRVVPLSITVARAESCKLTTPIGAFTAQADGGVVRFALQITDTGEATLECR